MGAHGRRQSDESTFLQEQEACKSVFPTWQALAIAVFGIVVSGGVGGWFLRGEVARIDRANAEESVQRTQKDSSLSYRIATVEALSKKVSNDGDTIKNLLRGKP